MPQQSDLPGRSGELAPDLRAFQGWTVLLFGASVLFHLFCTFMLHKAGHAGYPLSRGRDRFYDFTIFTDKFKAFHTAQFWSIGFPINYPAPAIVIFEVFFRFMRPHELFIFEFMSVLAFVIPAFLFARSLTARGISSERAFAFVAVITLLSWPAVLLVDGGNIEVAVWVILLIGMWAYSTGRLWMAAAFFALGASMKLFPFVLFGLFLSRRQYSKIVFGACVFVVTSWLSLWIVGPTVGAAYRGVAFGLASFRENYMGMWRPGENGVDHSMFALCKLIGVRFFHHGLGFNHRVLTLYLWIVAISGLALYLFRVRKLPLLNQVLILTIASIYFTAFSGDGTLIHLYYPCAMLFLLAQRAWDADVTIPGLKLALGCMVFILSFESFLVRSEQRYIGPAHCIGLAVLLITALRFPFGPPLEDTRSEAILSDPSVAWAERATLANGSGSEAAVVTA